MDGIKIMIKSSFAAATVAALMTTSALSAQEFEAMDWSGAWVGGAIGGLDADAESQTPGDPKVGIDGFYAALNAGYDHQYSNGYVVGAFLEIPIAMPDTTYTPVPGTNITTDINWAVIGGLRLGYAYDRFLPYALAGFVVGEGETKSATFAAVNQKNTHTGYVVGAGIDYAVSQTFIVGARYAYVDLGNETYTGYAPPRRISFSGHNLAITARYKF